MALPAGTSQAQWQPLLRPFSSENVCTEPHSSTIIAGRIDQAIDSRATANKAKCCTTRFAKFASLQRALCHARCPGQPAAIDSSKQLEVRTTGGAGPEAARAGSNTCMDAGPLGGRRSNLPKQWRHDIRKFEPITRCMRQCHLPWQSACARLFVRGLRLTRWVPHTKRCCAHIGILYGIMH